MKEIDGSEFYAHGHNQIYDLSI